MKNKKYNIRHFMVVDGEKKEIDPSKIERIADQCKLLGQRCQLENNVLVKKEQDEDLKNDKIGV